MIKAIFVSVFNPSKISKEVLLNKIFKYGFILVLIRWAYYTFIFSFFRDYKNNWAPFAVPPFGLTIETYALWQSRLSIFFGFFLMFMIASGLFILISINNKNSLSMIKIFNILGISYFIPFVILQPLDKIIINFLGWNPYFIIPLHSTALIWEAIISIILIDKICLLKFSIKLIGIFLQIIIWILLCALFWR